MIGRGEASMNTAEAKAELLTLVETAERLRISVRTVRRLTASGVLPIIRVSPRRVCVPAAAVDDYVARGGWQPENSRTVGFVSKHKWADDAYFADCQRWPPKLSEFDAFEREILANPIDCQSQVTARDDEKIETPTDA